MNNIVLLLKKRKGFSLMEMLIVVAILAILLATSAPIFAKQMNNTKAAADAANLRAAKSVANVQYMMEEEDFDTKMYYDITRDTFVADAPTAYGKTMEHSGMVISAIWNDTTKQMDLTWE